MWRAGVQAIEDLQHLRDDHGNLRDAVDKIAGEMFDKDEGWNCEPLAGSQINEWAGELWRLTGPPDGGEEDEVASIPPYDLRLKIVEVEQLKNLRAEVGDVADMLQVEAEDHGPNSAGTALQGLVNRLRALATNDNAASSESPGP